MHPSTFPWIVALSLRLYRWLLNLGPAPYRREYKEPTLQVFRQCCRDAYRQRGTFGVLALWLPMFSEAITGMLAEHLSALRRSYERIGHMLPAMRRSMIITLCAFIFFGVAYIFLTRVTDPRPPFDAVTNAHLDIRIAFSVINGSAYLAFLAVVLGGLPILFAAIRRAIVEKRTNPLALFALRPKQVLLLIGLTFLVEIGFFAFLLALQFLSGPPPSTPITPLPPLDIASQLGVVTLFTFVLLAGATIVSQAVLRSEFSVGMLRYALILTAITTLSMGVSFIATIVWIVRLWVDVPQFADSQGLGLAGLRGDIGGSLGVVLVIVMMALAASAAAFAFRRGLRARTLVAA